MIGHRREGEVLGRRRRLGFLKRRTESTSVSPCLEIHSVTLGLVERNTLFIPITIRDQSRKTVETPALVDSGAGGKFIDQNFARNSKMNIYNLEKPMKALNVDGTENKRGTIKQYVDLTFTINERPQTQRLFLTGLGKQKIILGFPWLQEQNPVINWKTGEFRWQTRVPDWKKIRRLTEQRWKKEEEEKELKEIPKEETKDSRRVLKRRRNETNQKTNETTYISTIIEKCREELQRRKEETANIPNDIGNIDEPESNPKSEYRSAFIEEVNDEEEFKTHTLNPLDKDDLSILIGLMDSMEPEEVWINARTNVATELAAEENKKKEGIPIEKLVPKEYQEYFDVFHEEKANRFPEERSWDHKSEMKEGFEPKSLKSYNLTPEEQIEQDKFIKENLEKGYIRNTVKQVRSFLRFGNFYRRFIHRFSELPRPLNDLTKKDKKFEWTNKCQDAFDTLKKKFTEEQVLMIPDHSQPFQIKSDASKVATGAVLTQLDSNGDRHPCSFISKTFSPTEQNYKIYDRELLGIIRALEEWRHYIQGPGHTTIIHSDHKNLTFFKMAQKLN